LPTAAERAGDFSNLVRTNSGWLPSSIATRFNQSSVGPANIFQQFNLVNGKLVPLAQTCTVNGVTTATYCQFPGNRIPTSLIDPKTTEILKNMPAAGDYFIDDAGLVRNYIVQRFVTQDETRYTLRLDHSTPKDDHMSFRDTQE